MAAHSRFPPLIRDLIPAPHPASASTSTTTAYTPHTQSLTLLTTTLATSVNWLAVRFLAGAAASPIVLVSFLRPFEFWRTECKRATGVDLLRLGLNHTFIFVDGLCSGPAPSHSHPFIRSLGQTDSNHLQKVVGESVTSLRASPKNTHSPVTLLLDGIDFLLALEPPSLDRNLFSGIHSLRKLDGVNHTIITASADSPLLIPPSPPSGIVPFDHSSTTLAGAPITESAITHTAFLVQIAHVADLTISLRPLPTGTAPDVSGVGRVTFGAVSRLKNGVFEGRRDGEWLYCVRDGDASVTVWER